MKAIIAAGGSGTRLRPLTFSNNKHLLPVANKPLLMYPVESILETGIKDIGVVVNHTRPQVEQLLGDGSKWGVKISYIEQLKPLGLAHVVKICKEFLEDKPFVYHLGDNIFSDGIMRPYKRFVKEKSDALLTVIEHKENYRLGVPFMDDEGNLIKVVEKPENPPNNYAVPGLYFFNKNVFKAFEGKGKITPSTRGELEITDLYTYLINNHYKVVVEGVDGEWLDPGKFIDMLDANFFILDKLKESNIQGEVDNNTKISGNVIISEGARVVNSQIVGPVCIGKDVLIEDSVVGPHVAIADNCKVESVVISTSVVMQDSSLLSIKRKVVDSLIGKNTEIWEGKQESVSLFIGDHCKVRVT